MEYKDLLSIPFKYGGRDKDGMDCYGVVLEYYRRKGFEIEDAFVCADKDDLVDNNAFETYCSPQWKEIKDGAYQEGDVLLFSDNNYNIGTHCAIYLPGDRLLHSLEKTGITISYLRHFKKKLLKAYRWQD